MTSEPEPILWEIIETDYGDLHVMPLGDSRPHTAGGQCWCCPRQDDHDGYVIIHDAPSNCVGGENV